MRIRNIQHFNSGGEIQRRISTGKAGSRRNIMINIQDTYHSNTSPPTGERATPDGNLYNIAEMLNQSQIQEASHKQSSRRQYGSS